MLICENFAGRPTEYVVITKPALAEYIDGLTSLDTFGVNRRSYVIGALPAVFMA